MESGIGEAGKELAVIDEAKVMTPEDIKKAVEYVREKTSSGTEESIQQKLAPLISEFRGRLDRMESAQDIARVRRLTTSMFAILLQWKGRKITKKAHLRKIRRKQQCLRTFGFDIENIMQARALVDAITV